PPLASK
nr:Chain C, Pro-Pro-Leu-Ala-Ser-Lys [Escherichia coli BL21(DE3)]